ncbi:MAG: tRNA-binding protein [Phycisphaerales bacterium]
MATNPNEPALEIEPEVFFQADLRVGVVHHAELLAEARIPAYRLEIDFGPLGIKRSSAQLTRRYEVTDLIGRRIVAVVNFPPRRIAGFKSEVLVLGAVPNDGDVSLLSVDHEDIPPGTRIA